jgi:hypothetical protein
MGGNAVQDSALTGSYLVAIDLEVALAGVQNVFEQRFLGLRLEADKCCENSQN